MKSNLLKVLPDQIHLLTQNAGEWETIFTDTERSHKQFKVDITNLPAGTILSFSFQTKISSEEEYKEFDSVTLSTPVDIPSAPAQGYMPIWIKEWSSELYGFRVQANIVKGKLPKIGLAWALYKDER